MAKSEVPVKDPKVKALVEEENKKIIANISQMFSDARKETGIIANKVAEKSGITRGWLSQLEGGGMKKTVNLGLLSRIADTLGYKLVIELRRK
jgi:transcriptional regulator with XRE-family HTH domain